MPLQGKRYTELDPTLTVQENSLLAVYNIGDPELSKITFVNFQQNIRLKNLFDFAGEIIADGDFVKYNLAQDKFVLGGLVAANVPNLPTSKITGLDSVLTGKEPSFNKGNIVSTTISITNGTGRLVGANDLTLEVNFASLPYVTGTQLNTAIDSLTANSGVQRISDNFSVDATVLRTNVTDQFKTGLLSFRRGSALGETLVSSFEYPDNSGNDYNLRLYNNGLNNNVRWSLQQTVSLSTGSGIRTEEFPVLGFKNGITVIGAEEYAIGLGVENHFNAETDPIERFPLSLYNNGQAMFSGRVYAGKTNYDNTLFLTVQDSLYAENRIYARDGFRTKSALDDSLDANTWILGGVVAYDGNNTPTNFINLKVDGVLYKVFVKT